MQLKLQQVVLCSSCLSYQKNSVVLNRSCAASVFYAKDVLIKRMVLFAVEAVQQVFLCKNCPSYLKNGVIK